MTVTSAAKALDAKLLNDRSPDLVEILKKNGDYQKPMDASTKFVSREHSIPLPDVLYEQYDLLQCRSFLGLFPEIQRAWITIDHRLFLWNYDARDDFQVFDDQDQVIVSVGLVKPKQGVFLDQINYLLVIATPVEIILVAIAATTTNGTTSLKLYRTDMSISSDNVSMFSIIGSKDGRIFMCGSNGRLYELQYQALLFSAGAFVIPGKSDKIVEEPNGLLLNFVRPPPQIKERYRLHEACYAKGVIVACNSMTEDTDSVICISPNRFSLEEMYGADLIEGKAWSIAVEENVKGGPKQDLEFLTGSSLRFLILSNSGIMSFLSRSPLDYLELLLEESFLRGTWAPALNQFLSSRESEDSALRPNIVSWAKRLFLELGSQPVKRHDMPRSTLALGPSEPLGRPLTDVDSALSGRLDGLTLFLAKLLQPLWKYPLASTGQSRDAKPSWKTSFASLKSIQHSLLALRDTIEELPLMGKSFSHDSIDFSRIGNAEIGAERESLQRERVSLQNMLELLNLSIEGTSFALFLMDIGLPRLVEILPKPLQQLIVERSFEELITSQTGRDLGKIVFSNIVQSKIDEGIEISAICESTHQQCPSFCTVDDIVLYKGIECIKRSLQEPSRSAENLLAESLRVKEICDLYVTAGNFYRIMLLYVSIVTVFPGAIKLVLSFAIANDPSNLAISFYNEGMPANDFRESFYKNRILCYTLIQNLYSTIVENQDLSSKEIEARRNSFLQEVFSSDDKLLHFFIFDLHLESGSSEKLLEFESPYLEDYLGSEPLKFEKINTLWRLYVKKEQYMSAAQVLYILATSKKYVLNFSQRFEILQLAVANALSASFSNESADFKRDLEDQKDVAKIQMDIFITLKNVLQNDDPLFQSLLSISDLYKYYAQRYNLYEISLEILHVSNHRDQELVQNLWTKIFGEDLTPDQFSLLIEKIKAIGSKFYPDENVFPLAFLCSKLEYMCYERGWNDSLSVAASMRSIKIPFPVLFQVYFALIENKSPPWNTPRSSTYLVLRLCNLLQAWFQDAEVARDRSRFPLKAVDDAVSKLLLSQIDEKCVSRLRSFQDTLRNSTMSPF
ncbi:hypothetical protein HDU97_007678 [Phlyctochytrium planicorne]|nr:hypothetical protein HDU97_007678 [Phlyctochytrium planicorne]